MISCMGRVGFLPKKYFFRDTRKKWKKPISSNFAQTKLDEIVQNYKKSKRCDVRNIEKNPKKPQKKHE